MVSPTLTSPCSCIPWIHCQSNKTHLLVLHSRRPQQLSFDSTDGVVKISENAQEKTYHSKQKKCRVTYLLRLPTFAVDECSSLLKVICILIAACMIDFIVDFCSSLKTYTHAHCLFIVQVQCMSVELHGIAQKLYHLPQCTPVFIAETFDMAQLGGTNKWSAEYLYPPRS